MARFFHILFLLLASSMAASLPSDSNSGSDRLSLREILRDMDEAKAHDILHALSDKFRHGVFQTDDNAIDGFDALRKTDASIENRLLKLAKRQNPENSTTSSTSQFATSSLSTSSLPVPSTSSTETDVETTLAESTSAQTTPVQTTSREAVVSSTTSSPSVQHRTSESERTVLSTSSSVAVTSDLTSLSAASATPQATPTTSSTSTAKTLHTAAVTTEPTRNAPHTSTYLSVTTLAGGHLSTITRIEVVYPTTTEMKPTATPSLQNVGAIPTVLAREIAAIAGGVVIAGMIL